ncbi:sialidase family protein [Mucilaginibacter ginsenosidivorax]|uniref:sialidase family protein n=1 Tax=Mucilaginibacter ginsenosidivorax TaxID=862126 RepID=UPI0013150F76|nr:sialidase family protein [Mucilaginibacter ginsenosidivorax]
MTLETDTTLKIDTAVSLIDTVFQNRINGYAAYRAPVLLNTQQGTLIAFCEGRKIGGGDSGEVDVVFRRSVDNGKTWGEQRVAFHDGKNACDNPSVVQDQTTGTIWLVMSQNLNKDFEDSIIATKNTHGRTVWVASSNDDGVTWTIPTEITQAVKDPSWHWYATGPGTGIQLAHGPHKGRLIIGCDHSFFTDADKFMYSSHIIYSDDHGVSWHASGNTIANTNECQPVEVSSNNKQYNGEILLNSRYYGGGSFRAQSNSYDGGITWTASLPVLSLTDPICEGSIYRYSWKTDSTVSCLLFSNLNSLGYRVNLTLKMSLDEGRTWQLLKVLHKGPAGYSSLSVINKKTVACLYESGTVDPYETIVFVRL